MAETKKVAQVLSGFAYKGKFYTSGTPAEEVNAIPQDVLKAHEETGFVRFVEMAANPASDTGAES
jgi:hypothetical protein